MINIADITRPFYKEFEEVGNLFELNYVDKRFRKKFLRKLGKQYFWHITKEFKLVRYEVTTLNMERKDELVQQRLAVLEKKLQRLKDERKAHRQKRHAALLGLFKRKKKTKPLPPPAASAEPDQSTKNE